MGVTGIGGLFFRSRDPEARATWYRERLGIDAGSDRVWGAGGRDDGVRTLSVHGRWLRGRRAVHAETSA